jgi:Holliday junction resolvase RusA-like endonuclease
MIKEKVILNITPQTNVRATQGDRIFFRIPREKLKPQGLKRLLRLERYNKYKIDLLAEAKSKGFTHPEQGGSITFYIPMPKTWRKFQRETMHFKLHQSKPDLDNLLKAYFDSLLAEDKGICHYEAKKVWVDFPIGWIEITVKEPEHPVTEIPRAIKDLLPS